MMSWAAVRTSPGARAVFGSGSRTSARSFSGLPRHHPAARSTRHLRRRLDSRQRGRSCRNRSAWRCRTSQTRPRRAGPPGPAAARWPMCPPHERGHGRFRRVLHRRAAPGLVSAPGQAPARAVTLRERSPRSVALMGTARSQSPPRDYPVPPRGLAAAAGRHRARAHRRGPAARRAGSPVVGFHDRPGRRRDGTLRGGCGHRLAPARQPAGLDPARGGRIPGAQRRLRILLHSQLPGCMTARCRSARPRYCSSPPGR
jgi:hypothetical protein